MQKIYHPPKLFEFLLERLIQPEDRESLPGDFGEIYNHISNQSGVLIGVLWYLFHIVKLVPAFISNTILWSLIMFKNFIKITLRNIRKYKGYSFINIAGLVIGMTCFILILLYVQYEFSYDGYHKNVNEIYRMALEISYEKSGGVDKTNSTPFPLKAAIENDFPDVLSASRVHRYPAVVKFKDQIRNEQRLFLVDQEFLDIFSFPLIQGNSETALTDLASVLMTQETAVKYFGREDPLGKIIQINNQDHKVTGILKDIPKNSHFLFDILAPFSNMGKTAWGRNHLTNWESIHCPTYILLKKGVNLVDFKKKLPVFFKLHAGENTNYSLHPEPLKSIHLEGKLSGELESNSDIRYVFIFATAGLLILLIACFNYINLSTARSERRAKEVGIRKVVGADRRNLTTQFFMESMVFSILAFILSLPFVKMLLPVFSSMVGRELNFNLLMSSGWFLSFIGLAVFVGLVSGAYPAFYLASFKPAIVLKGVKQGRKSQTTSFRNVLVVGQFVISVALVVCTLVITQQLNFIRNRNLGFNKEHIVAVTIRDGELRNNLEPLKNSLRQYAKISDVSYQERLPNEIRNIGDLNFEGMMEDDRIKTYITFVENNYLDFYNIKLAAGRGFSREMRTDSEQAALVNQSAAKAVGYDDPIGKKINVWGMDFNIIGVMEDFHFLPLHQSIAPLVLGLSNPSYLFGLGYQRGYLTIKISSEDIPSTLTYIEEHFKTSSPNYSFDYSFLDDRINRMYQEDKQTSKTFSYFSLIAIVIACLGLFGLATYSAERRTKEIGIRKVLGSSILEIFSLVSRDLTKWILISNVVAWPIAYFVMKKWLENFAYKINFGWSIFLLAGALAFVIALLTVSFQAIKVATTNPVNALKYE